MHQGYCLFYNYHGSCLFSCKIYAFLEERGRELDKMPKTEHLSKEKISAYRNEFLLLDTDGDGSVSTRELADVLRTMRVKFKLSEGDIRKIIKEIDVDGNGSITVDEYMNNMKDKTNKDAIHRALIQRSSIRREFHKYDADGSGYISKDELKQVLKKRSKLDFSDYQIQELLEDADMDDNGKIDYEEFVVMMTK